MSSLSVNLFTGRNKRVRAFEVNRPQVNARTPEKSLDKMETNSLAPMSVSCVLSVNDSGIDHERSPHSRNRGVLTEAER